MVLPSTHAIDLLLHTLSHSKINTVTCYGSIPIQPITKMFPASFKESETILRETPILSVLLGASDWRPHDRNE